ncbi:MAG: transposase [Spirochaetaceae bacterium]|nr:transposase [Spirochaetaceae bacterium]
MAAFVKHPGRDLTNAVLYPVKTGCQRRLLPKDFPPYDTVWPFYRRAVKSGKREKVTGVLVKKLARGPDVKPLLLTEL